MTTCTCQSYRWAYPHRGLTHTRGERGCAFREDPRWERARAELEATVSRNPHLESPFTRAAREGRLVAKALR